MLKEEKGGMMKVSHQIENINEEIEITKKNQREIVELKSTRTKMKNALERLNVRFQPAEEKYVEFIDK